METEFKPTLNIIIGKNGSGKTNFLSFLYNVLQLDFKSLGIFSFQIELGGEHSCEISASQGLKTITNKSKPLSRFFISDPLITFKSEQGYKTFPSAKEFQNEMPMLLEGVQLISHGIDKEGFDLLLNTPLGFSIKLENGTSEDLLFQASSKNSFFITSVFTSLLLKIYSLDKEKSFSEGLLDQVINFTFDDILENINSDISVYLPIEKVRLNPNYKFYEDLENSSLKVEGILLDFYVNGSWLPFSSLSDGTKRLFYIYAEILISGHFDNRLKLMPAKDKIILLEEPELGIHPHQFHLVMLFLQRVSKHNQLIVTTHAPQALNLFTIEELDAIHICTFNANEGTRVKKLSKEQVAKAKYFMEDMYLSDYWMNSDLEE